ncbi:glycosyltransferase family 2 protein [Polaromonas sp.]|uniref:glycosyltransferase family 2 protein n=1 Tax=Polaromonas sp. TaxID=1869339 RepID=UPI0018205FB0|nr:glycosyltransferase family 2 protein [Polaromonas sp.]NMM06711.1 glycosyltransferase family 2 protein [Polaromonas sp.]
MEDNSKIFAVVVTYYPDLSHLAVFIRELCAQFERVVIVDNGSPDTSLLCEVTVNSQVDLVLNKVNLGIGAAQNIGIENSLVKGVTHVIVFDQDSMVTPGFRKHLIEAEEALKQKGVGVAAVGPKLIDQATGNIIPFVTFVHGFKRRLSVTTPEQVVECFSLLSSGTLMSRESLETVGLMREDLFLEYVDVEWGARARLRGLKSYGVAAATLFHNLGDQRLKIGPIIVPLHSPLRHYYTMRNAVAMQKHPAFPLYWKFYDIVRTVRGFLLFACVNPPRLKQVKFMLLGLYHGVIGKSGPFPGK